jgi:pyruvate-formate lyase-activating enzyme
MKKSSMVLFLAVLSICSYAQTATKTENIRKLLELTGSGKIGVQVAQNMIVSFKKVYPSVPDEFWEGFKKELNSEVLVEMVIPIYDKYYTETEIKELTDFYATPIGRKVITVTPLISQESMQAGQKWGKELGEKLYKDLNDKGLIKKE